MFLRLQHKQFTTFIIESYFKLFREPYFTKADQIS